MVYRSLLVLAGLTFFLALLSGNFIPDGGVVFSKTVTHTTSQEPLASSLPIRLTIPAIHVDAAIEYVGLTSDGAMDAPKDPTEVGWLSVGTIPGEKGTAVMAGHFGWKNNVPAVFDVIDTLRKGDAIYVIDNTGITTTFIVRELRTYASSANTEDVFYSTDGKAHLNLITCEGIWDIISKSYSGRLVVFADKNIE